MGFSTQRLWLQPDPVTFVPGVNEYAPQWGNANPAIPVEFNGVKNGIASPYKPNSAGTLERFRVSVVGLNLARESFETCEDLLPQNSFLLLGRQNNTADQQRAQIPIRYNEWIEINEAFKNWGIGGPDGPWKWTFLPQGVGAGGFVNFFIDSRNVQTVYHNQPIYFFLEAEGTGIEDV